MMNDKNLGKLLKVSVNGSDIKNSDDIKDSDILEITVNPILFSNEYCLNCGKKTKIIPGVPTLLCKTCQDLIHKEKKKYLKEN